MTVIIITHNSVMAEIADKVVKMKNGMVSDIIINKKPMDAEDLSW